MLNENSLVFVAIVVAAFMAVILISTHTEDNQRETEDNQREKENLLFFGTTGVGMFGCALDMLELPFQQNIGWCIGYLTLLAIGRWLMKASLREHLQANAYRYIQETYNPR
jgi:hypothetical protein